MRMARHWAARAGLALAVLLFSGTAQAQWATTIAPAQDGAADILMMSRIDDLHYLQLHCRGGVAALALLSHGPSEAERAADRLDIVVDDLAHWSGPVRAYENGDGWTGFRLDPADSVRGIAADLAAAEVSITARLATADSGAGLTVPIANAGVAGALFMEACFGIAPPPAAPDPAPPARAADWWQGQDGDEAAHIAAMTVPGDGLFVLLCRGETVMLAFTTENTGAVPVGQPGDEHEVVIVLPDEWFALRAALDFSIPGSITALTPPDDPTGGGLRLLTALGKGPETIALYLRNTSRSGDYQVNVRSGGVAAVANDYRTRICRVP